MSVGQGADDNHVTIVEVNGDDAMTRLIDVWVAGYTSGVASAFMQGRALANGVTSPKVAQVDDDIARTAYRFADAVVADPLFIEEVRREITHILTCPVSGPEHWTVR